MNPKFTAYRTELFLMLYLLWMVFNQYALQHSSFSLFDTAQWGAVCLFYLFGRFFVSQRWSLIGLVAMGTVECTIALLQGIGWIDSNHSQFAITGTLANPGQLGGFLSASVIACACLLTHKRTLTNYLTGTLLCFLSSILLLTDSRAGWLGAWVGIVIHWLPEGWNRIKATQWRKHIITLSVLLFACLSVMGYYYKKDSADGRLLIWKVTTDMISEHPFCGMGENGFRRNYIHFQADYFQNHSQAKEAMLADNTVYPYNEILKLWSEHGAIGVILFAVFFISYLSGAKKTVGGGHISAVLTGIFMYSMFSYPSDVPSLLLLFFFLSGNSTYHSIRLSPNKKVILPLLIACMAICCAPVISALYFERQFRKAMNGLYASEDSITRHEAEAYILRNYEKVKELPDWMDTYALYCFQQAPTDNHTVKVLQDASLIVPTSDLFCDLGDVYKDKGESTLSKRHYLRAAYMVPSRLLPKYKVFDLYRIQGDTTEAVKWAEIILSTPVKVNNTLCIKIRGEAKRYLSSIRQP